MLFTVKCDIYIIIFIFSAIKQEVDEPDSKKIKTEDDEESKKLDKIIEKQNKAYYNLLDKLKAHTRKPDQIAILEANDQSVPEGNQDVCY